MSEQTDLILPSSLPFPLKITKLLVHEDDSIQRGTPLLYYSFKHQSSETKEHETLYGTWESHVDGTVVFWNIEPGDEVQKDYGPVLVVVEPCKHGQQIAGMCAICGKDMTEVDYISNAASERAKIRMDHSGEGPSHSAEEAAKIERENSKHLLGQRKLSLVVDLDQTILHATVDPTVGEWLKSKRTSEVGSTTPPAESANFPALDDVVKFQLADDHGHSLIPHPSSPWYYIKPRPGLTRFMSKISKLYEMHVYTMGTRSYANAVCASLDPSGAWFGSRILTRSTSGSDRYKSLQRLFPSDQSMVVIIDDRADVWGWSPNLVRVIPFDFFVGTGDINSSFLPKQPSTSTPDGAPDNAPDELPAEPENPLNEPAKPVDEQAEYVHKKMEERPLAKAQEVLEATAGDKKSADKKPRDAGAKVANGTKEEKHDSLEHRIRKAILNDDDRELERIEKILEEVHQRFYKMQDAHAKSRMSPVPDVANIIPSRKSKTFVGVHMVFSGVFPLQERPENTDVWKTAIQFGATCSRDITPEVTHLVAAKPGTAKTDKAFEMGTIKVVHVKWFHDSVARWEQQPEQKYLMDRGRRHHSIPPSSEQREQNGMKQTLGQAQKEEGKVSAPDGATENGTNATISADESSSPHNNVQNGDASTSDHSMDANGVSLAIVGDETFERRLSLDWAEIDREVEDALASDDDDDDEEGSQMGTETDGESSKMEDVVLNTWGVKRRRVDSAPSTPSKLRFSFSANGEEQNGDEDSPSSKRRKVEDITSSIKDSKPQGTTLPAQEPQEEAMEETAAVDEEDDDDFLARGMAGGDDWDDDDDDEEEDEE